MNKCNDCALLKLPGGCPVFKADMSGQDGCPMFAAELERCDLCGGVIFGKSIVEEDNEGKWHTICHQCLNASRCQICINQYCAFQQDQSCQEQPYVMIERRQGNMIMQTQQLNPKRVEATCRKGCPCFNEDGLDDGTFCLKQLNCGCKNYKINWRN